MRRARAAGVTRTGALALLGALWLTGDAVRGQVLRGVVRDVESGEAVALAYVGLLAPGDDLLVAALADIDGRFTLRAPSEGSYLLHVSRHGYHSLLDGIFELGEGGVMDLAIGMRPSPVALDSVVVGVEAGRADLRSVGFYQRQEMGVGRFLEREDLERAAVTHLTDALQGIPRLRVTTPRPRPGSPSELLNPEILVRQATGLCSPTLYVDGMVAAQGGSTDRRRAVRPDDYVDPGRVEAVEVYASPVGLPLAYRAGGGCGVVLIWTRFTER